MGEIRENVGFDVVELTKREIRIKEQLTREKRSVKNSLHLNITLISPLTAGLLNVFETASEVIKSMNLEWKNRSLTS